MEPLIDGIDYRLVTYDQMMAYHRHDSLKQLCRQRQLPIKGSKAQLTIRLLEHENSTETVSACPDRNYFGGGYSIDGPEQLNDAAMMAIFDQLGVPSPDELPGNSKATIPMPAATAIQAHAGGVMAESCTVLWEFELGANESQLRPAMWQPVDRDSCNDLEQAYIRRGCVHLIDPKFTASFKDPNKLTLRYEGYKHMAMALRRTEMRSSKKMPPRIAAEARSCALFLLVNGVLLSDIDNAFSRPGSLLDPRHTSVKVMEQHMDAVNTRLEDAAREMSKEMDEEDRKSKRKALMSERASKPPLENDEFQKSVLLSTCRGNVKNTEQLATVFRTDPEMQKKAVALLGWELDCIKWYPRSKFYFERQGKRLVMSLSNGPAGAKEIMEMIYDEVQKMFGDASIATGSLPQIFRPDADSRKVLEATINLEDD